MVTFLSIEITKLMYVGDMLFPAEFTSHRQRRRRQSYLRQSCHRH